MLWYMALNFVWTSSLPAWLLYCNSTGFNSKTCSKMTEIATTSILMHEKHKSKSISSHQCLQADSFNPIWYWIYWTTNWRTGDILLMKTPSPKSNFGYIWEIIAYSFWQLCIHHKIMHMFFCFCKLQLPGNHSDNQSSAASTLQGKRRCKK